MADTEAAEAPFQLHGGTETMPGTEADDVVAQGAYPAKDPPRPRNINPKLSKPVRARKGSEEVLSTYTNDAGPSISPASTGSPVDEAIPAAIPAPDQQFLRSSNARMGKAVSGAAAVARLGKDISAVARAYGKQPEQLTRLLLKDDSLKVDEGKRLLYACPGRNSDGAGGKHRHHHRHHRKLAQFNADAADPLPATLAQSATGVPLLHSRPTATRKMYLDFDGHTTTGKASSYIILFCHLYVLLREY
jgi:hypothetical protein